MAASGRLSWYVIKLVNAHREDENERTLWDIWIHKVWNDVSFDEFKRKAMNKARNQMKNEYIRNHPQEVAKTVEKSRSIMQMFDNPVERK